MKATVLQPPRVDRSLQDESFEGYKLNWSMLKNAIPVNISSHVLHSDPAEWGRLPLPVLQDKLRTNLLVSECGPSAHHSLVYFIDGQQRICSIDTNEPTQGLTVVYAPVSVVGEDLPSFAVWREIGMRFLIIFDGCGGLKFVDGHGVTSETRIATQGLLQAVHYSPDLKEFRVVIRSVSVQTDKSYKPITEYVYGAYVYFVDRPLVTPAFVQLKSSIAADGIDYSTDGHSLLFISSEQPKSAVTTITDESDEGESDMAVASLIAPESRDELLEDDVGDYTNEEPTNACQLFVFALRFDGTQLQCWLHSTQQLSSSKALFVNQAPLQVAVKRGFAAVGFLIDRRQCTARHVWTFDAFSYVIEGKRDKRYCAVSSEGSHGCIAELGGSVFVYKRRERTLHHADHTVLQLNGSPLGLRFDALGRLIVLTNTSLLLHDFY